MIEIPDIELIRRVREAHMDSFRNPFVDSEFDKHLQALEQRLVELRAELAKKSVSQHGPEVHWADVNTLPRHPGSFFD